MTIKLKPNSSFDGQLQETNTAARNYYLPNNDSGVGTQLMTAQATTSGTSIDFTGIPSWVKRVTVMFNGVSTNGSSIVQVQLGAGSIQTTGYISSYQQGASGYSSTTGFATPGINSADARRGAMVITLVGSNIWVETILADTNGSSSGSGGGSVTLSGTLDRLRLTTVGGTDTFDAGSVNVMYE